MTDHDLRTLLEDAVADVEPRHGLEEIQARTATTRKRHPWVWGTVAAVAATAATVAAVTVVTDRSPQQDTDAPAASQAPEATGTGSGAPTEPAEPSVTEDPTPLPTDPVVPAPTPLDAALPVYYVGDTPAGPRLYREFQQPQPVTDLSARMLNALDLAVGSHGLDPDYVGAWTTVPFGVKVAGAGFGQLAAAPGKDAILIALDAGATDLARRPASVTVDQAELAVQALVYTAQAAVQQTLPVQFTGADGLPMTRLLGVDVSRGVMPADPMQVQASVWVIDPADGATVGPTFTVKGRGAFFEATVNWQLLQDGKVVKDGVTNAAEGMTLSPYSFTVKDVPPGEYTLRVYEADMSSGEGTGEEPQDTKRITVR